MATVSESVADRSMSVGRVYELGFNTIRHNPVVTLVLALVFGTIPGLATTYASSQITIDPAMPLGRDFWLLILFSVVAGSIFGALTQAVLTRAVVAESEGRRAGFGETLRAAMAVVLPLIGLAILYSLAVGLGFVLLIVPGLILMVAFSVAAPALVEERLSVFAAFGRSRELTRGAKWKIFGLMLILFVGYLLVSYAVEFLTGASASEDPAILLQPAYLLTTTVLGTLINVLWGTVQASLYVELRDWKDGPAAENLKAIFA